MIKDKILEIINNEENYNKFASMNGDNMFKLFIEAIKESENDDESVEILVNYIYSLSLMYESLIGIIGENGNDEIKLAVEELIKNVFEIEEE